MNEIFVEEENTVYELDPECLKRKEEQRKKEKQTKDENKYKVQKTSGNQNPSVLWIFCLLCLIVR